MADPRSGGETERRRVAVDHLVVATPDLEGAREPLERRLGCALEVGGSHPGFGTRNLLLGLGSGAYLELVGPDPAQPAPAQPRPFGIDALASTRLVAWAVRVPDLSDALRRPGGEALGEPRAMSRRRQDDSVLRWRLAFPRSAHGSGSPVEPLPFLIDWLGGRPPGDSLPAAAGLRGLEVEAPDPVAAGRTALLGAVDPGGDGGVEVTFRSGPTPLLRALLDAPAGVVELC